MKYEFGVEAGRCITRDGKPFVTIGRCNGTHPCDADTFARELPNMIKLLGELASWIEESVEAGGPGDPLMPDSVKSARELLDSIETIRPDKAGSADIFNS